MAAPVVFAHAPAASLFRFPPHSAPEAIPPPHFDLPFTVPDSWYVAALDPKVPITIATLYAVSAKALNAYNRSTGKKPWAISRTRAFHAFVVLHNVFLAVYSAWTWLGMLRALQSTVAGPSGPHGWVETVDSLCKLHGPAGLGNAQAYDQDRGVWESVSGGGLFATAEGTPSRADAGRLWNDGLAFYGWLFYLSKFYEVLDTLIILAKGKLSSTLQTYHHAGAMMAMWAGMRYMSTPIWIFVFFNSAIHALMYTYYTITAFNIRVPTIIKRTLTSLQISQFIIGASCAMAHSFVSYLVPVQVKVPATEALTSSLAAATAAAPTATAAGGILDSIKQSLFGVAEAAGAGAVAASPEAAEAAQQSGFAYVTRFQKVDCISTSGATFAIWLNVVYLAPLTYLFVSFFITSYLRRSKAEGVRAKTAAAGDQQQNRRRISNVALAEKASWDAARGLEREVYGQQGAGEVIAEDSDESSGNDRSRTGAGAGAGANGGAVKANGKVNGKVNGTVNGKANGKKH
ncbi:GNS1/SUR4 family-domain-containing protein [Xylariomycetidae sp. FL2044]|nr:GNS1/SUR4 family-domain-containing protein [Xylariomycetidae sp. FL2044]